MLFTSTGFPGHLLPLIPFASAFARAGHGVRVASPRSRGGLIEEAGLDFQPFADPPAEGIASIVATAAQLPQPEGSAHMLTEGFGQMATASALADIEDIVAEWRPDAVVRESHEFAGGLVAERDGIPQLRVALGIGSIEDELASLVAAPLDEFREWLGLPADPAGDRIRSVPLLSLTPPALEEAPPGRPAIVHRFRAGGPRVTVDRDAADPLVYVTLGSVVGMLGYFPRLFRRVVDALADVPVRVLLTTGPGSDPAELGTLPSNVRAERWVTQERVLDQASAVVCHGGYGSTVGALVHGVPVVALPLFSDDQWANARRVADAGAGIALGSAADRRTFDDPCPEVLDALPAAVMKVVTDPQFRDAARRVARSLDEVPPVDVAARLLDPPISSPPGNGSERERTDRPHVPGGAAGR